jgi:translocation and assembly module TamB
MDRPLMSEAPTIPIYVETEPTQARPKRRRRIFIGIALLLIIVGAAAYLTSDSFQNRVRLKVISELERVTGGRVDLPSFTWNLSKLEFIAQDLTIHGLEPPSETPYAHVDSLKVRLKILSVFGREIGLRAVDAQHPVIHIIVNPDGSTNQPRPKLQPGNEGSRADVLFNLAIDRTEVSNGLLIWNEKRLPLDFTAEKVSAHMTYAPLDRRYEGKISVGGSLARLGNFRPLPSEAEIQFSIINTEAGIKSLKWSSPASRLEASGRIVNFFNPEVELTYSATVSLAELGSTVRMPELRSGTADVQGFAKYSTGGTGSPYSSNGKVVVKSLGWRTNAISVSGVDATSAFSLDREKLALTGIVGRMLGGTFQGDAHIQDWAKLDRQTQRPSSSKAKLAQRGRADFRVSGMRIGAIASAFTLPRVRFAKLNAQGSTAGTVNLTWKGSPADSDANLNLDVTPLANPAATGLPVTAHLRGLYSLPKQLLDITELDLITPATHVIASGALGSESAQLTVKAETSNLHELDPLLSARETGLPLDLQGRAAFTGTVDGKFVLPTIRGHLELAAFDSLINLSLVSPSVPQPAQRVRWDSAVLDLQYSPKFVSVANGSMRRGTAQIAFSGRSTLQKGQFDESSAFFLQTQVRNAALAEVQSIVGTGYPITGTLNLSANASGTLNDLHGNGRFEVASGTIYGESFKSLHSDIRFVGKEAQFSNIALSQNGAQVTGSAAYNLTTKVFRFDARGNNFDLAHITVLQSSRLTLAGLAHFQASGSGTFEQPTINASLQITRVIANTEAIGDITAKAVTRGREMQITAQSHLNMAELNVNGTVQLENEFPGRLEFKFSKLDFDPLLRAYLGGRVSGHSSASGTIVATGPLRQPKLLRASGTIDELTAEIEKVSLRSHDPITFSLEDQTFKLQQFHITGEGTDLTAEGNIGMVGEQRINVRANGQANLKLFQGFSPGLLSYGITSMQLTAAGTIANPSVTGEVKIQNAGVSLIDLPNGLSDINGTLVFNENRLQIKTLTARTGGGTLNVGGFIAYRRGLFFNLTANGQDIRLRYPPGISAVANTDLRLSGTLDSALLSGDVLVTRFGVNPNFDFALYLARSKQPATALKSSSVTDNLRLDVHVVTTPELEVQTSLAKIAGDADLRLRGSIARPVVLGRINIVEGDIFFSGTKYHLERGDISFTNPVRIEPVLNVEATARVREYDITLGFHGSTDKLSTNYRSEPPLPTADIIALLALGRTRQDTALSQPTNQTFTDTASNAILGQALNAALSSRVQKLFGVSRIKIDPQVGGPENNPNARLTIEQEVNKNITLTYITNLASSAQQVIQVEYNVNRSVSLLMVRDQNGVIGFEVRMRQRKK